MTNPVCPSCYRRLDPHRMMFRCSYREVDTDCGEVFESDGTQVDAFCPKGHTSTRLRECQFCHSRLPPLFGRTDARLVAMMGATFSGKTVYLTTLIREWNGKIGDKFHSAVMPVNDSTADRYAALRGALENNGIIPGTDRVEPYVFTIDLPGSKGRTQKLTCSFLDSPGESQVRSEMLERYARYISSADGIILLLDPVTMDGAAGYLEAGQGTEDRDKADNRAVVQRLVSYLLDFGDSREAPVETAVTRGRAFFKKLKRERGEEKMSVPVAVVLTKTDAVESGLAELASFMGPSHHDGFYDATDLDHVDGLVRGLIRRWDGPEIEQLLNANFSTVKFFAASSLGHPTEDGHVNQRGWQPRRVADPLLWLLSEFELIPVRTTERR